MSADECLEERLVKLELAVRRLSAGLALLITVLGAHHLVDADGLFYACEEAERAGFDLCALADIAERMALGEPAGGGSA